VKCFKQIVGESLLTVGGRHKFSIKCSIWKELLSYIAGSLFGTKEVIPLVFDIH